MNKKNFVRLIIEEGKDLKEIHTEVNDELISIWDIEILIEKLADEEEKAIIKLLNAGFKYKEIANITEYELSTIYKKIRKLIKRITAELEKEDK